MLKKHLIYMIPVLCLLFPLIVAFNSFGADLTWDPVTAEGSYPITDYKIYYGEDPGPPYPYAKDVGNVTSYSLDSLEDINPGRIYYFAVTACTSIEEGFLSEEVFFNFPASTSTGDSDDDKDDGGGCFIEASSLGLPEAFQGALLKLKVSSIVKYFRKH